MSSSLQPIIRLALLSVIALCGCSTGTPDFSSMSFNPFSGLTANWTTKDQPSAQYGLAMQTQPKKRMPSLDWFRRGGSKASNFPQASPNQQAMFPSQALAQQQTAPPVFPQQGFSAAYQQGMAPQSAPQQGPFVNPAAMAANTTAAPQYGVAQGHVPPTQVGPQYGVMPQASPVQHSIPAQNTAVASYGQQPNAPQQYQSTPAYPGAHTQYSTASQSNAPQYTQPAGFSGSSLR